MVIAHSFCAYASPSVRNKLHLELAGSQALTASSSFACSASCQGIVAVLKVISLNTVEAGLGLGVGVMGRLCYRAAPVSKTLVCHFLIN